MHGAHLGIARSIQPAMLPFSAAKTNVAQESFGASWAKAIQASAKFVQKAPMVSSSKDAVAAPMKKPEAASDQEENVDAAPEVTKAVQAQAVVNVSPALQCATKDVVEAEMSKKVLGAEDKDAVSATKKHKDAKDSDANADAEMTPQVNVTAVDTNAIVLAVPVAAAALVPMPVSITFAKSDGKAIAKVDASAGKRPVAIAKSDGTPKTSDDEVKSAVVAGDSKAAPVVEVKEKTLEIVAAPIAAHAVNQAGTNSLNGGVVQGTVESAAPALAHKAETATVQPLTDVQSNLHAATADANAVQALAAGPGLLEVGVLDGTHGWLKIRAELGTDGSVSAQLTSTATAHEGLKETLPAMTGFLDSESLNVSNIAVHRAAETSAAGTDLANAGAGSAGQGGSGGQGYQGQNHLGGRNLQPWRNSGEATEHDSTSTMSSISVAVFGGGMGFSGNGIGSWLSVTA